MRRAGLVIASATLAGAIFYMAILSPDPLPDHRLIRGYNDLVMHFIAFAVLSVPCLILFQLPRAILMSAAFAVVIEVAQIYVPTRSASLTDLLAGWVGILAAIMLYRAVMRQLRTP